MQTSRIVPGGKALIYRLSVDGTNVSNAQVAELHSFSCDIWAGRCKPASAFLAWFVHELDWAKNCPAHSLTWIQVRKGLAAGNLAAIKFADGPRMMDGAVEPKVQNVLRERLATGATFTTWGQHRILSLLGARLVGPSGPSRGF
jgi:hypothetical protein